MGDCRYLGLGCRVMHVCSFQVCCGFELVFLAALKSSNTSLRQTVRFIAFNCYTFIFNLSHKKGDLQGRALYLIRLIVSHLPCLGSSSRNFSKCS